jgi:hypothetical protein
MEVVMRDDDIVIRTTDLEALTPAQRSSVTALLVRQAGKARARAIGAALLWPARELRRLLKMSVHGETRSRSAQSIPTVSRS